MKRFMIWLLVACVAVGIAPLQTSAAPAATLVVDGETVEVEEGLHAYVEAGVTYAPFRSLLEHLGLAVDWEDQTRTAIAKNEHITLALQPDLQSVTINDEVAVSDVSMTIIDGRLFVPVRFLAEKIGYDVSWDQQTQTVIMVSEEAEEENNIVEDTDAFLKELIAASERLNSFSSSFDIEQTMAMDDEQLAMHLLLNMDVVQDPLGLYQQMKLTVNELGEDHITTESYLTEDGYFTFDSIVGKWIRYDDDMYEELLNISDMQMDPTVQFELMQSFIDDLTVYEHDNTYEVHMSITGEGFIEALDLLVGLEDYDMGDLMEELDFDLTINEMTVVSIVDKETLYPLEDDLYTDMTISVEGEQVQLVQKATSSYSAHNELESIFIPQEVIDEAITFEEYLELLGELDFEIPEDEIHVQENEENDVPLEEAI